MLLKLDGNIIIEDIWHHAAENSEELRRLLAQGVPALEDPHRKGFYEVENRFQVFYIHVCPNRKVLLLAIWPKTYPQPLAPMAQHSVSSSLL